MHQLRRASRLVPLLVGVAGVVVVVVWLASGGDDESQRAAKPGAGAPAAIPALHSRPNLRPPQVSLDTAPATTDGRLILLSPRMEEAKRDGATHQQGALMVDEQGRTVWFGAASDNRPVTDLRVQEYQGKPVLTWWEGAASKFGVGSGHGVIADTSYRRIATVEAGRGQTVDLHEFRLTPRGTALVTIYSRARRDLSSMGGLEDAQITQGIVQEIDVETGKVLFEWKSLGHVKPSESYRKPEKDPDQSFDYFHINSVTEDSHGDLLISARHTSTLYKVDRDTGRIVWRLGGKHSDFTLGPGVRFGFQHDAEYLGDDQTIRLFDNEAPAPEGRKQTISSVKVLHLDPQRMRVTLVRRLAQPDGMWAESQGSAQTLPDGGAFAGWGSTGAFTWFGPHGNVVLNGHLPAEYDSYRGYLQEWSAQPRSRPAIAARREKEQVTVWASWNGATTVDRWQVLAGPRPGALKPVGSAARWDGIETTIVRGTLARYVAVAALGADGQVLRRSRAVQPPGPKPEPHP